jgi:3-dehydroquinate dehydratase
MIGWFPVLLGLGEDGYILALEALVMLIKKKQAQE